MPGFDKLIPGSTSSLQVGPKVGINQRARQQQWQPHVGDGWCTLREREVALGCDVVVRMVEMGVGGGGDIGVGWRQ